MEDLTVEEKAEGFIVPNASRFRESSALWTAELVNNFTQKFYQEFSSMADAMYLQNTIIEMTREYNRMKEDINMLAKNNDSRLNLSDIEKLRAKKLQIIDLQFKFDSLFCKTDLLSEYIVIHGGLKKVKAAERLCKEMERIKRELKEGKYSLNNGESHIVRIIISGFGTKQLQEEIMQLRRYFLQLFTNSNLDFAYSQEAGMFLLKTIV